MNTPHILCNITISNFTYIDFKTQICDLKKQINIAKRSFTLYTFVF